MRLFLIGTIAVCYVTLTVAYKLSNEEEDTIVIEAGEDDGWRSGREVEVEIDQTTTNIPLAAFRSETCTTKRGQPGQCLEFSKCYPNLLPVEGDVENDTPQGALYNHGLAEILINVSGICEPSGDVKSGIDIEEISAAKRSEVLICCPSAEATPPPLPTPNPNATKEVEVAAQRGNCGATKIQLEKEPEQIDERIVKGREAKKGEFPWIVALMQSNRQFCGGSLIDSQYVLTAAHCVQHMTQSDVSKLTILIGDHNIYTTTDGHHETRTASKVLYNKGFSMKHLHHDVALIKLSKPVEFNKHIQPVCLHSGSPAYEGVKSDVAGWGQIADGGSQPQTLRTVNIKTWKQSDCRAKYGSQAPPPGLGDGMVCAGGNGGDSCRGDSGGPLSVSTNGQTYQIGIVSWGIGCGSYPGVYTRVDKYLSWINKNRT